MTDTDDIETGPAGGFAAELAAEIRRLRGEAKLSQKELAAEVGYTRQYVSLAERTGGNLPSQELVRALDARLNANGRLLALREQARHDQRSLHRTLVAATVPGLTESDDTVCSLVGLVDILGPDGALTAAVDYTDRIVQRYETEGPQLLAPELLELRLLGRYLGARIKGNAQRGALTRLGAQQAALLSYAQVNLGNFKEAARFSLEANLLATSLGDAMMLSWIKGTQSFSAYYRGQYRQALMLAEAGLRIAGSGPQRIRLLSNGVARAAAKLGDHATVERALGEALDLAAELDQPTTMTSCVSFDSYKWARAAANAATAFLAVGEYDRALDLTSKLQPIVAGSNSDWSRSLICLDEATALTLSEHADLDYAADVGMNALRLSASKPISSIATRATELAKKIQARGKAQYGSPLLEAVHDWQTGQLEGGS
jgi:transcriptional regulator with XRE-family HTH domain